MRLGVLCGLEREARIIRAALPDVDCDVRCSGAISENAARRSEELVAAGATHLLSFGLAGALEDHLRPGDLILPEQVMSAEDEVWAVDGAWRELAAERMREAAGGAILGLDRAARTAAQKLFIRGIFDAAAVDMESHILARCAAAHDLPLLVIRAISDDRRSLIPRAAMAGVGPNGEDRILNVLASLAHRPNEIGALAKLGFSSGKGFRTLGRVAGLALPA